MVKIKKIEVNICHSGTMQFLLNEKRNSQLLDISGKDPFES